MPLEIRLGDSRVNTINGTRRWRLWHGGVAAPFLCCPDCAAEHYGIVEFCGRAVERMCLKCKRSEIVRLPPLNKHILYLDQNALSNFLFVLRPDLRKKGKQDHQDFWQEAFDLVVDLVHHQAVVCPTSPVHRDERSQFKHERELDGLSRYLGQDISYLRAREIERAQLCQHFMLWLDGVCPDSVSFNTRAVLDGSANEWSAVLYTEGGVGEHPELRESIRRSRLRVHADVAAIHAQDWKDPTKTFEDHFRKELSGFFRAYKRLLEDGFLAAAPVLAAIGRLMPFQYHLYENHLLVLGAIALQRGASEKDATDLVEKFFASDHFSHVPFARGGALAWAQIAQQAGKGAAKAPNAGTGSDIDAFAKFGQFSDSMFTDKAFHMILQGPPCSKLRSDRCRVFSLQDEAKFLSHLRSLRNSIGVDQVRLVQSTIPDENRPKRP